MSKVLVIADVTVVIINEYVDKFRLKIFFGCGSTMTTSFGSKKYASLESSALS